MPSFNLLFLLIYLLMFVYFPLNRSHLLSPPQSGLRSENIHVLDQQLGQVNPQQELPRPATGTTQQLPAVQPQVLNHVGKRVGKRVDIIEVVRLELDSL